MIVAGSKKKKEEITDSDPKRLVTSTELAKYLGKSIRRIQALTQNGVIATLPQGKGKARRYDLDEALKSYITYVEDIAYQKKQSEKTEQLKDKKLAAEAALKESQSDLHKLKTDIQRGKYVPVEDVELDYKKFFSVFKNFATAIPNRVAMMISNKVNPVEARKIENDIAVEIDNMLRTFTISAVDKDAGHD
jgi:phage terminase Nu1 subunit (DNA packaging protein)